MAWLGRKPVIANRNCAAFREMIRHRDNGFLVGADWELLAAMRELATDAAECGRIGAAGFAEVHARFTWPAVARAVMEVLEGGKSEGRSRELVAVRQLDKSGAA
jgi:glycosyltransferase involved in cell wall biosynthesis